MRKPGDLPSPNYPIARRVPRAESWWMAIDPEPVRGGPLGAEASTTIVVCSSCRAETGSDERPRPGERLALSVVEAARGTSVHVRSVECLGNCKRRLSAALLRDGCWGYVFGDLDLDSAGDLVAGAELFAAAGADGILPWRGRPDVLKRGLVARIPPLSITKDLA